MTSPFSAGKVRYEPAVVAPQLARLLDLEHHEVQGFVDGHPQLLDAYDMDAVLALAGVEQSSCGDDGPAPGRLLNLGLLHLAREDFPRAVATLTRVREAGDRRESAAADLALGFAHQATDRAAAMEAYERAAAAGVEYSALAALAAAQLIGAQDLRRAARMLAAACRVEGPYLGQAAFQLGLLLKELDDPGGAENAFRRAMSAGDPEFRTLAANSLGTLLSSRSPDAAVEAYRVAVDSGTAGAGEAAVNLGLLLAGAGHAEEALASYRRAVELPDAEQHARALTNIGELLHREGRPGEAESALRAAIELRHPFHSYRARFDLGSLLNADRRFEEARRQWELCLNAPAPMAELARAQLDGMGRGEADEMSDEGAHELAVRLYLASAWSDVLDILSDRPEQIEPAARAMAQIIEENAADASREEREALHTNLGVVERAVEIGITGAVAERSRFRGVVDDDIAVQGLRLFESVHFHRTTGTRAERAARVAQQLLVDPRWPALPAAFTAWVLPLMSQALSWPEQGHHDTMRDRLVEEMRAVVGSARPEDEAELRHVLAMTLLVRHPAAGDADEAVGLLATIADESTADPAARAAYRSCLAEAHAVRASADPTGHEGDLDRALGLAQSAVSSLELLGEGAVDDLMQARSRLMKLLGSDFRATGARESVDRAVDLGRELVADVRGGQRLALLHDLALLLIARDDETDLAEATGMVREALELVAPGSAYHLQFSYILGLLLTDGSTYPGAGNEHVLRVAELLDLLENDLAAQRAPQLQGSSADLRKRLYERTGEVRHLDIGIATLESVLRTGHAVPTTTTALAELLRYKYQATGRAEYVQRAVHVLRDLLAAERPQPDLHAVAVFGDALVSLSQVSGDLSYLDEAVGTLTDAHGRDTSHDAVTRALAQALENRGDQLDDSGDLERAIGLYHRLRDGTGPRSSLRPHSEGDVGTAVLRRWGRTGDPVDLDAGISALRIAVGDQQPGRVGTRLLNNLARALTERYRAGGAAADLDEAVGQLEVSLAYESQGSAMLPMLLASLGSALALRHGSTGRPADAERAVAALRSACRIAVELGVEEHGAATEWALWASERGAWDEAAEAADLGLESAYLLFRSQLTRAHREARLTEAGRLAAAGAHARARLGDPAGAALMLESGMALLLSDTLERERTDLSRLSDVGRADLAEAYGSAAAAIADLERTAGGVGGPGPDALPGDRLTGLLRERRAELDRVIAEIRAVDGYSGFLTRPRFEDIVRAAAHQPVVFVVSTPWQGLAVIVEAAAGPRAVLLPELTDDVVRKQVVRLLEARHTTLWRAADEITAALWPSVMGPLLEALGECPAATLVPAGLLSLLPLHAAWTADPMAVSGRRHALDSIRLTHAPNARAALVASGWAADRPAVRLLAVDNPQQGSAPVNSGAEIAAALARFPDHVHLSGADATLRGTLAELPACDVLHFACHGQARFDQPLKSSLILAGGERLTLRTLIETRVEARLAVLAACETAVPGLRSPNESVGLPSTLLAAGTAGIIASLWPVPDDSTNLLMAAFYENWREGTEPAEALRQAQRWLRDSTNREKRDRFPGLLGPEPGSGAAQRLWEAAMGHSPAYFWSGFTYTGS